MQPLFTAFHCKRIAGSTASEIDGWARYWHSAAEFAVVSVRPLAVIFLKAVAIIAGLIAIPLPASAQDSRLLITVIGSDHDRIESPLSGVMVRVKRREDGQVVGTGTTDRLGFVEIIVPPLRTWGYTVGATIDGYEPGIGAELTEMDVWAVPGDIEVRFPMQMIGLPPGPEVGGPPPVFPDKGRVFGRVMLPDGTPLPRTTVHVRGRWGGLGTTAEDGSFRLEVLPGVYTIHADGRIYADSPVGSRNGDYPSPVVVASRRDTGPVDVVLEPLYLFNVTITATDDVGDPIPGAHIEAAGQGRHVSLPSEKDGVLIIKQIPPNSTLRIIANARLGDVEFAGSTSVDVTDADQAVSVVLRPAAKLSGRVEFGGRLTPLHSTSALEVTAHAPDTTGTNGVESRRALVGPDGRFTLTGLIGEMCLSVVGIPRPWYVVDVTQQSLDVTNKVLTFNPGEEAVDVLIRVERAEGPIPERPKCKP